MVTPEGAEPGSLPVVLFTHGEDDGVAVELTVLLTPILQALGLSVPSSYRAIGRNPSDSGTRCFPSEGLQHVVIDPVKQLLQVHVHDDAVPFGHVLQRLPQRLVGALRPGRKP